MLVCNIVYMYEDLNVVYGEDFFGKICGSGGCCCVVDGRLCIVVC